MPLKGLSEDSQLLITKFLYQKKAEEEKKRTRGLQLRIFNL
ncbi:hypothetical protein AB751O23_CX_00020 [Chlamydiales bacterium SCGC AB-751-O23]|nr:hypothetical protein AB751O23_CX_00020 [Chlamydiales bacterium SCGC AB-751-O23]